MIIGIIIAGVVLVAATVLGLRLSPPKDMPIVIDPMEFVPPGTPTSPLMHVPTVLEGTEQRHEDS